MFVKSKNLKFDQIIFYHEQKLSLGFDYLV